MKVYLLSNEETSKLDFDQLCRVMPNRIKKAKKFIRTSDRLMCIGAGALLHSLTKIPEYKIRKNSFGKPYVDEKLFFSLSHSGNFAACAISNFPIGIDIEEISENNLDIMTSVFTNNEISWLNLDPLKYFHSLWSVKESVFKAIGTGITENPKVLDVHPEKTEHKVWFKSHEIYYEYTEFNHLSVAAASFIPLGHIEIELLTANDIIFP